jgi:heat shock protein HtpX
MNIYKEQEKNIAKTWALMALFLVFIILIGWGFSWYYNNQSILYFAVVFSILMNIFSYWFSDKIVLAISGAKPITRDSHRDVWTLTENLCIARGLPMPKLYYIEDASPNAFATGRNKEHAAVAVTTGLLQVLEKSELEGVLAHELAHVENRDILISTIVVTLVGLVTLISDFFFRMAFFGRRGGDKQTHPAVFIIAIVLAILAPLVAVVIQLAISRKREFLADATGALMTRYPEGLASALEKIHAHSARGPMRKANHATAHLYIANPFGPADKKAGFLTKLFMTHPPVQERLSALRGQKI